MARHIVLGRVSKFFLTSLSTVVSLLSYFVSSSLFLFYFLSLKRFVKGNADRPWSSTIFYWLSFSILTRQRNCDAITHSLFDDHVSINWRIERSKTRQTCVLHKPATTTKPVTSTFKPWTLMNEPSLIVVRPTVVNQAKPTKPNRPVPNNSGATQTQSHGRDSCPYRANRGRLWILFAMHSRFTDTQCSQKSK